MNWQQDAVCKEIDPDLFFPDRGNGASTPRRICKEWCPVRRECLEAAMAEEHGYCRSLRYGVRGGMSPTERSELAEERGERVAA
ncbi:WhiB family transcription factor [Mycobacterium phage Aegeus]|nr:WhiB family transcription factor [Mycobacterium phage Baudelaire]WKW86580.1 WhiB family transcription factor [Mycobacterium phage Aegeus]